MRICNSHQNHQLNSGKYVVMEASKTTSVSTLSTLVSVVEWPIVIMKIPEDGCTDQEFRTAHLQILGLLKRNEPFCLINDATYRMPNTEQVKLGNDLVQKHRDQFRGRLIGNVLVTANPLLRMGIKAIHALVIAGGPPFVVDVKRTMEEGRCWCDSVLETHKAKVRAASFKMAGAGGK